MTLLPLPSREAAAEMTGPTTQLVPFAFVRDFFRETKLIVSDPGTYGAALTQSVVFQPLFNVALTLPFGIFLRYYYKKNWLYTLIASFLLSLFFEITQLTGVYGIYPRAFRLFDVDDLFLNTLGGMIGYWLTPLFAYFFPTREEIEHKAAEKAQTVSLVRRFIAYIIDLAVIRLLAGIFFRNELVIMGIFTLATSVMMMLAKGQTLGCRFVNIRVSSWRGGTPGVAQILIRQFSFYFFTSFIFTLFFLPVRLAGESIPTLLIYLVLLVAHSLFLAAHFIVRTVKGPRVYFHERLSGTRVVSSL